MARITTSFRSYQVRPLDFSHLALLAFQAAVLGVVGLILALAIINTVFGVSTDSAGFVPSY